MFRRGGKVNDGIMTGLEDREQLANGTGLGIKRILNPDLAKTQAQDIINIMEELSPTPKTRLPLGTVGLALASGVPFVDAFGAGYQQFVKKDDARQALINKRKQAAVSTAIASQLGGKDKDSKTFKDLAVAKQLENIIPQIYTLEQKIKDKTATKEDAIQLDVLKTQRNNFTKTNPVTSGSIDLFVKSSQGQTLFTDILERLYREDQINESNKYKSETDVELFKDVINEIKSILGQFSGGGRVKLANGGMDLKPMQTNMIEENPISYDQLRARLPKEITDDVVKLISVSSEALEDFANITNQKDIDNFNKKYSVNLVLPSEA
jgi:hypothetical protein